MLKSWVVAAFVVAMGLNAFGQMTPDEAMEKLRERQATATTAPSEISANVPRPDATSSDPSTHPYELTDDAPDNVKQLWARMESRRPEDIANAKLEYQWDQGIYEDVERGVVTGYGNAILESLRPGGKWAFSTAEMKSAEIAKYKEKVNQAREVWKQACSPKYLPRPDIQNVAIGEIGLLASDRIFGWKIIQVLSKSTVVVHSQLIGKTFFFAGK